MASIRETLINRRNQSTVTADILETSKQLPAASWALWGEETPDLSVFDTQNEPHTKLRLDVVTFGGNLGLYKPKNATGNHV